MGMPDGQKPRAFWDDLNADMEHPEFRDVYIRDSQEIGRTDADVNDARDQAAFWQRLIAEHSGVEPDEVRPTEAIMALVGERQRLRQTVAELARERDDLAAQLHKERLRLARVGAVHAWRNEDGKGFLFADDVSAALADPDGDGRG